MIDVLVAWPRHCDYPLWREQLRYQRGLFGRVLVAFTNHHGRHDYRRFVAGDLDGVAECFDADLAESPNVVADWRDIAVNACLERSTADWVLFTEQDLLLRDPTGFWERLGRLETAGAAGWKDMGSDRWHPSFLLARRELVEGTRRWFGPEPVDHFYAFGRELQQLVEIFDLRDEFGFGCFGETDADVMHMAGLSHNHRLADSGQPVTFKPDDFAFYLECCLAATAVGVQLERGWARRAERWLADRPPR